LKNLAADSSAKFLCVGDLEAGFDPGLQRWARESGRAIFSGPVPKPEAKKYFAAFDCHVHPTYREGFGMVLQEAGAMGCAIVTTDVPGASEVMEDGISCLLARPRDADSLEKKMRRVMADAVLRDSLGRQARKRVETCYDRQIRLELLRKHYEEFAKKGSAP
jgi:glycosyltransferase involved in cell wall biosynthesis